MELSDGTVIEGSCPVSRLKPSNSRYNDIRIYKASVERTVYTDDPKNKTGNVEYDLIMFTGNSLEPARSIKNAVTLNSLGGINDYSEIIYKEKTKTYVQGSDGGKAAPENVNGDIVALFFLEGNETMPVILGPWSHKKNTQGATKTDGHRIKGEYNGVEWEINKDGEFIVTMLGGPRDDDGNLTNESNGGIFIKFHTDGTIEIDGANVKLGTEAAQSIVRGDAFRDLFNAHYHQSGSGPTSAPVNKMDASSANTHLSEKHRVE